MIQTFLAQPQATSDAAAFRSEFTRLAAQEVAISLREPSLLVHPSGDINSKLGLKLHYPTMTTSQASLHDGESADPNNPCARLLIKKGLPSSSVFWFEMSNRREKLPQHHSKWSPIQTYSSEMRLIHREISTLCESSCSSKVLLVFGRHNRLEYERRSSFKLFNLSLEDSSTVQVSLSFQANPWGSSQSPRISRIHVFADHPEYHFRPRRHGTSRYMDTAINIACALAGLDGIDESYFERRAMASGSLERTSLELGDNALSDSILTVSRERADNTITPFSSIPRPMLYWLAAETGKTAEADIRAMVPPHLTMAGLIHSMISRKGAEKSRATGFKQLTDSHTARRDSSSYRDMYTMDGPQQTVRVHCNKCKVPESQTEDTAPGWCLATGKYIARKKITCPTAGCCDAKAYMPKGKKAGKLRTRKNEQLFVPVDETMAWIGISRFRSSIKG